jgi:hypothetical protein
MPAFRARLFGARVADRSPECAVGCSLGQSSSAELGTPGCCSTAGKVQLSIECSGIDDDSNVFLRVRRTGANACLPYTLTYNY